MGDFLLGIDIGTSFVKASLLDAKTGLEIAHASAPERELEILAPKSGWAEQDPQTWWSATVACVAQLKLSHAAALRSVRAIGITYQMHGLVLLDSEGAVLRPSIIWCDSRAVPYGTKSAEKLGDKYCRTSILNSPGNFTASKLKWVFENEPQIASKITTAFLPGDFIAYRFTSERCTTSTGLSEMILWDFATNEPALAVLNSMGLPSSILPSLAPTFGIQGKVTAQIANELGLTSGTPVSYRAGDQPNNAYSLKVCEPGEIAATAGTSGVIYGVSDTPRSDETFRVNTFEHVTSIPAAPRLGVLLCINGTGISYSWARRISCEYGSSYEQLDQLAAGTPIGSEGLTFLPFGNGAERMLNNQSIGAQLSNIDFNRLAPGHLMRAVQEGIACSFTYGLNIMLGVGVKRGVVRAGAANLFKSSLFCKAFAGLTGCTIELLKTDGAQGAARGAGMGAGLYSSHAEALSGLSSVRQIEPQEGDRWQEVYGRWHQHLQSQLQLIGQMSN